jgi:hypothetical protein
MIRAWIILCLLIASAVAFADTIRLKYAEFDPAVAVPTVPTDLAMPQTDARSTENYLALMCGRNLHNEQAALEAQGVRVLGYLPDNTFVVRATALQLERLARTGMVRWYGPYQPAYKVSREIGVRSFQDPERQLEEALGWHTVCVTLFDGMAPDDALRTMQGLGMRVRSVDRLGALAVLIEAQGSLVQIRRLAHDRDVAFIEPASEATLRNDLTRWVVQSNINGSVPIWDKGLLGQNQIVGLIDGRMYMGHNCFRDPVNNTPGPNHRKVVMYSSSSGQGSDSHGTHTAGTLAGDQEPITGSTYRNGMAYKARIAFTNLGDISSSNLYSKFEVAYNAGARDHSNSWGDDGTTSYTNWCRAIDLFSYTYEDNVVAFAVTNTSTLKTPENAKSCLAVGASNQSPNQHTHGSGGAGPTNDGRRKPEVYAPGIGIWSAQAGSTSGWASLSGTSMACPAITGMCALVRQYYREGWWKFGLANSNFGFMPSGALVRATIMNAGVDMTGVSGYPSNTEGWGRLLLNNALFFKGDARRLSIVDKRNANGLTQGQVDTFYVRVNSSSEPLRVTMTFTDYPAQALANPAYINDMDLEVTAPNGNVYLGNQITNGQSSTGGSADIRNSTEMVMLNSPTPGKYRIRVKCTKLAQGNAQGYALVITGSVFGLDQIGP